MPFDPETDPQTAAAYAKATARLAAEVAPIRMEELEPPPAEFAEFAELTDEELAAEAENSANSTNSAPPHPREHPIPEDSILASYRDFARQVTEAPDSWIAAPVLALCGKLLTPNVWLDFAGRKPLTIFNFVVGPAGLRKSTTFAPAEAVALRVLTPEDSVSGNASDSALFDSFERQPHRLQLEDEGNTILRTWATTNFGKEVAARYLKLYDGRPWSQNFRREADGHADGQAERHIDFASLSLCIGSTYGVSRFDGIDAASGLRRRFGFYLAGTAARFLPWPTSVHGPEADHHADNFRRLTELEGVVNYHSHFTPAARQSWEKIQRRNRDRCAGVEGITSADETLAASLNESPARILKLALIFQACRWAAGNAVEPLQINPGVLEIAEAHQNACLDALEELETIGRRAEIDDLAEAIRSRILADAVGTAPGQPPPAEVFLTKTDLTRMFASNPGRAGALAPSRLHREILPAMIRKGQARIASKKSKKVTYAFATGER